MIDSLIAFRILYMLVTPFKDTTAFKLGIVDANGKLVKSPETSDEKNAYNMLVRLVFNLKRILAKLPGGDSKLKNIAAAYFLIKEHLDLDVSEQYLHEEMEQLLTSNVVLVEETITLQRFLQLFEDGMAVGVLPANHTGAAVATDEPKIDKTKKKRIPHFTRDALKDVQC